MKEICKMIAVDMDGTLLKSDKTIHPESVCDIKAALTKGVQVVYCTGRALSELKSYFKILPMIRYAVCYSGAIVYDCKENECIYRKEIKQNYINEIVKIAKKYYAMIHFLTERESIVSSLDLTHMKDFYMGEFQTMFMEVTRQVNDMEEEGKLHDSMAKINIYFRSAEERSKGYEELKQFPLTFAFAGETSLEITAQNVTKATGLEHLTECLQISIEQVAGIGDSDNDRDMLSKVGFSVAMGNAKDDIKEICDYVTNDNDHNGVGEAIKYIIFNFN